MTAPPAGALEACPACGAVPDQDECPYPIRPPVPQVGRALWLVSCSDPDCGFSCVGEGKDGARTAWNTRPALLAALRLREWRPIESAPKDGTEVLLSDGNGSHIGEWLPTFKCWHVGCDSYGDEMHVSATHWMPLPAPPPADDLARVLEEGE